MPDVTAASSPAPTATPADPSTVLAGLTSEDRAAYRLTGRIPESTVVADSTPDAESSPAAPAEPAPSTEGSPKTEAAAPEPAAPKRAPKNAETRKAELDKDIQTRLSRRQELDREIAREEGRLAALAREEGRLAALRQPSPAAAPAPDAGVSVPDWKRFASLPDAPKVDAFEDYGEYTAAMAYFIADQRFTAREQAAAAKAAAASESAHLDQQVTAFRERLATVTEAEPGFLESLSPDVLGLVPTDQCAPNEPKTGYHALADHLRDAENGPRLMKHFSDHPAELHRIARLHPAEFYLALGKVEAALQTPAPQAPKTVSSAPSPPTTVGRKATEPSDDTNAAVTRGDYRAYKASMNRRATAR